MKWSQAYSKNSKTSSGWIGKNDNKIVLKIVKKMSNQLWISIPTDLCKELLKIEIAKNSLGSKTDDILN